MAVIHIIHNKTSENPKFGNVVEGLFVVNPGHAEIAFLRLASSRIGLFISS